MNVTVAVTGLNATDNPAPGTGVIRALREDPDWRGHIVGLAYDALDTAAYDDQLVDEVHLIPYPAAGSGAVYERLMRIHRESPIDVLIPTLDSELANFVRLAPELERKGIRTLLPDPESLRLASKLELHRFCEKRGFLSPRTTVAWRRSQVREATFPIAIKGVFHGAEIAHTVEQAEIAYDRLIARWGAPLLIQQFVEGEEYDVVMLGDREGEPIGCVPMRKLGITDRGKAWAAVTVRDPRLREEAMEIFRALHWRGPLELEFVREDETGDYHLIEINPRFPAWCYLSVGAGQNLPAALTRLILGERLPALPEARPGVTFVRHAVDLVCSLEALESLVTRGRFIHRSKGSERRAAGA
jgi:carbamoyl-phosphate synthase large subunit